MWENEVKRRAQVWGRPLKVETKTSFNKKGRVCYTYDGGDWRSHNFATKPVVWKAPWASAWSVRNGYVC